MDHAMVAGNEILAMAPRGTTDRFKAPTDIQFAALTKADRLMTAFATIDHAMPSSYIRMFLKVAMHPGKGITDYANDLGVYQAVGSRILLEIGPKARMGGKGLELVEAVASPNDLRTKHYFLTRKGRKLFDALMGVLDGVEVNEVAG